MEDLQALITRIVQNIDKNHLDERIFNFTDYKNKFVVLKPSVKVEVELTEGKVFRIDVSDYFEGVIK